MFTTKLVCVMLSLCLACWYVVFAGNVVVVGMVYVTKFGRCFRVKLCLEPSCDQENHLILLDDEFVCKA